MFRYGCNHLEVIGIGKIVTHLKEYVEKGVNNVTVGGFFPEVMFNVAIAYVMYKVGNNSGTKIPSADVKLAQLLVDKVTALSPRIRCYLRPVQGLQLHGAVKAWERTLAVLTASSNTS